VSYFFLGAGPVFGGLLAPSGGDLQAAETRFFTANKPLPLLDALHE
jgi:hypothetical protein